MNNPRTSIDQTNDDAMSVEEQTNLIVGILVSFIEADDWDDIADYVRHIGFDMNAFTKVEDFIPAWLGHYRIKHGAYDVDRACHDLVTFPPVAARIAELQAERGEV